MDKLQEKTIDLAKDFSGLKKKEHILMKVMDSSGKQISLIKDEELEAGSYQFTWNAEAVPPGVYFLSIALGDELIVKQLVRY